ncbi:MAG: hypothetical protein HPY59_04470 [Anaerolineae bacterium]|nr:hypothetical protein [Anaerolineae bacterium]
MKLETWVVAICLILLIVVINLGLLVTLRRRSIHNQFEPLSRAIRRARRPWQEEDEQIKELSRRVAALQSHPAPISEQEEPPSNIG